MIAALNVAYNKRFEQSPRVIAMAAPKLDDPLAWIDGYVDPSTFMFVVHIHQLRR
jgi:hypothetical protein